MEIIRKVGYAQAILDSSADFLRWNTTVLQITSTGKLQLQILQHAITWVHKKIKKMPTLSESFSGD
jgi:hypothetical protein